MAIIKNDLVPGQIVKSKAGHDKGCVFFVVEVLDDEYVLIAENIDLQRELEKSGAIQLAIANQEEMENYG